MALHILRRAIDLIAGFGARVALQRVCSACIDCKA